MGFVINNYYLILDCVRGVYYLWLRGRFEDGAYHRVSSLGHLKIAACDSELVTRGGSGLLPCASNSSGLGLEVSFKAYSERDSTGAESPNAIK